MGARTNFVQAMLIGAVVGAALTTAIFQLRGKDGDELSVAAKPVANGGGSAVAPSRPIPADVAARTREIAQLRARIAELERAGAMAEPDADRGMSTSDEWWAKLPPNPAWDAPREQKVIARLAKLGVTLDPKDIECKTRCCRFVLAEETSDEHWDEIRSAVGLDFERPDGLAMSNAGDAILITKCWAKRAAETPYPDRLAEREALLAKVAAELARCGAGVSPPITLKLTLALDEQGQVSGVESNAKELGQKAASCAETALLQGASFASAPAATEVPLTVVLGK